ncbi:MAG: sugar phosphate isomerase/epimerase [Verrucomicrobia bacterium]|nr:sugar phosphate isomerase/epimerase [Verrucomicrobiota bacterium]
MKQALQLTRREFLGTTACIAAIRSARPLSAFAGVDRPPRDSWQIGCYTRPWDQHDFRMALDGIAEAGFKYAGIMTAKGKSWVIITPQTTPEEAAQVGEDVRSRGLSAVSVYGDFPATGSVEKGVENLRRLIDNCAACGSPNLMLGGTSDKDRYQAYYQAIAECCDYALGKGVGLSIKPHGGLNATGAQCRKALGLVSHKNFGLWYDPGNIYYYSEGALDPVEDAASVDGLVVGMSVKDYLPPKEVMVTPGTGKVRFPEVIARLKQGGFTHGPLVVECLKRGTASEITAEAKKARQFLEELIGQKY